MHLINRAIPIAVLLLAGACGSDGDDDTAAASAAPTTNPPIATTTAPPTTAPAADDEALVAAAMLTAADLGGDWTEAPPEFAASNSAELAATLPSCEDFVDVVFEDGADHGVGLSGVLGRGADLLFLYVVVFPTEAGATAMLEAVSDPAFDACWADFNVLMAIALPFGITAASYESIEPPELTVTADDVNVESVTGTVEIGGSTLADSCICVFARSGRGVVEAHSPAVVMDPAERSAVAQIAVDKLAATLAAG